MASTLLAVDPNRVHIFISHANPEDNEFTRWLGVRLAREGYPVWSDVIKLLGGENFQNSYDSAIRGKTRKFLYVVSRRALTAKSMGQKNNYQDELVIAEVVRAQLDDERFVIPLLVDAIDPGELGPGLIRKNCIDFSVGWMDGLKQLLKLLHEDGVQRVVAGPTGVGQWWDEHWDERHLVQDAPDHYDLNVVPFDGYPAAMNLRRLTRQEDAKVGPVYKGQLATLGPLTAAAGVESIPLETIIAGTPTALMSPGLARRFLAELTFAQVQTALDQRGLSGHIFANRAVGFFYPEGGSRSKKTKLVMPGRARAGSRVLSGRSDAMGMYWHFAAQCIIQSTPVFGIRIAPHVVFSSDGVTPLDDVAKMHSLRRKFCKLWYSDRWHGLTLTFVKSLVRDGRIELGNGFVLRSELLALEAPVTYRTPERMSQDVERHLEPDDPLDGPEGADL